MFAGNLFFDNNGLVPASRQIFKISLEVTDTCLEFILLVQVSVTRLG